MRSIFKAAGYGVAAVVGFAALVVGAAYATSGLALTRDYALPRVALPVTGAPAQLERGRHLAETRGCNHCHGPDYGGLVMFDEAAVGTMTGSNLTAAGVLPRYDDAALEQAIRHGVGDDGRALLFMPSIDYATLSDDDVAALVAFLRAQPPVERALPDSALGPLGRVLYLFGKLPVLHAERIVHTRGPVQAPLEAVTPEYGRYVAQACVGCHGVDFAGGPIPGMPPDAPHAANLTPDSSALGTWSEADFLRALREGVRPDGRTLRPPMPPMPNLTETEQRAMWAYFRTLPARARPGA